MQLKKYLGVLIRVVSLIILPHVILAQTNHTVSDTVFRVEMSCVPVSAGDKGYVGFKILKEYELGKMDTTYVCSVKIAVEFMDSSEAQKYHVEMNENRIISLTPDQLRVLDDKIHSIYALAKTSVYDLTRQKEDLHTYTSSVGKLLFGTGIIDENPPSILYLLSNNGMAIGMSETDFLAVIEMISRTNTTMSRLLLN